ncbi:hypothetical protein MIR68_000434 [Amoeboaphelidium protococcarum]|nr:hypothetical protein MIR68_000434 [Amoeboaphelidium protococcarum]
MSTLEEQLDQATQMAVQKILDTMESLETAFPSSDLEEFRSTFKRDFHAKYEEIKSQYGIEEKLKLLERIKGDKQLLNELVNTDWQNVMESARSRVLKQELSRYDSLLQQEKQEIAELIGMIATSDTNADTQ